MRYHGQLTGRAGRCAARRLAPLLALVLIVGELLPGAGSVRTANAADSIFGAPHAFGPFYGDMRSMASGDMDGDGMLDLIVGNAGSQNIVYLNDGAGNFSGDPKCALVSTSKARCFGSSYGATTSVAVGDINGDGALDIVAGNSGQSAVYLNDGAGNFPNGDNSNDICKLPRVSCFGGAASVTPSVVVGDINGDGALDLIAAHAPTYDYFCDCYTGGNGVFYLNDGTGNFYRGTVDCNVAPLPGGVQCFAAGADSISSLALGDLNGDGALDLVVGSPSNGSVVLLNDSTGNFLAPVPTGVVSYTSSLALGDLNGDNALDLVVGNQLDANMVLLNDLTGNFLAPVPTGVVSSTSSLALGDLNGDGALDLVVGFGDGQAAVALFNKNDKTGGFNPPAALPGNGNGYTSMALGDLNGDRIVDVALGNYAVGASSNIGVPIGQVFLNTGKAGLGVIATPLAQSASARSSAVGDLNNDGWADIVLGGYAQPSSVYLNNQTGGFGTPTGLPGSGNQTRGVALGDLNADGWLDIVLANNLQASQIYLNNGAGSFGLPTSLADAGGTSSASVWDLNNDGWPDIVLGNEQQDSQIYLKSWRRQLCERCASYAAGQ